MHFFNPVPLMALVEVIRGRATSDETFQTTMLLCEKLGKKPVGVNDAPGFVSNRVLMPMINEAALTVMEGVATPEAVDAVMKLGMNHPMGPLELADLIGLDVCVDIMDVLHRGFGDAKYAACPLLKAHVAAGRLGRKSGQGFYKYQRRSGRAGVQHLRRTRSSLPPTGAPGGSGFKVRVTSVEDLQSRPQKFDTKIPFAFCSPYGSIWARNQSGRVLGQSARIGPPAKAGPKRNPS